jgi:hypothetical protein
MTNLFTINIFITNLLIFDIFITNQAGLVCTSNFS